ncbi:MAG: serine hydrolase domain-containing protein [Hyphomonadaceae bacterium]
MLKPLLALTAALALGACAMQPASTQDQAVQTATDATGWNAAALAETVAYVQGQKTTGFLIIQDSETIFEHNWPLSDTDVVFKSSFAHGQSVDGALREDVASQQKSFIAILVGVGIDKGLIDIERPVSAYIGSRWSKATPAQESAITVRNLMEMNSGLKEDLTFDVPPDTKFFYNTPAYAILKPVLEKASGMELNVVTQMWLTKVGDMHDTSWEKRPAAFADVGNPTGLVTTPRDIARLGQIVLNGGTKPNGGRIISKAQLDALFVRTKTNPAYGHLWWLNGSGETGNVGASSPRRGGQLIPPAPGDMVAALGAMDRKLFIVPSMKLIVVRTGQAAPDKDFNEKLWQLLMKAVPQH